MIVQRVRRKISRPAASEQEPRDDNDDDDDDDEYMKGRLTNNFVIIKSSSALYTLRGGDGNRSEKWLDKSVKIRTCAFTVIYSITDSLRVTLWCDNKL